MFVSDGQNDDVATELFDIVFRVPPNHVPEAWVLRNGISGVLKCDCAQDITGLEDLF